MPKPRRSYRPQLEKLEEILPTGNMLSLGLVPTGIAHQAIFDELGNDLPPPRD